MGSRGDPDCDDRRTEPFNAAGPPAAVREHRGRTEDAIALPHTRDTTPVNGRDRLGDLLSRHDRIEELRAYAAEYHRSGRVPSGPCHAIRGSPVG